MCIWALGILGYRGLEFRDQESRDYGILGFRV